MQCYNFSLAVDDEDVKDLREPLFHQEIKNDQWMGVTVRSQGIGGKVNYYHLCKTVACNCCERWEMIKK